MVSQRLMITGSSGFIGRHLVLEARRRGLQCIGIDRVPGATTTHTLDILNLTELVAAAREFDPTHVAHLAARTDLVDEGAYAYAANIQGTRHVIRAVQASASVEKVIWASSRLVTAIDYSPKGVEDYKPSTQYGVSKVISEVMIRENLAELPTSIIVRPTSIWGPGFGEPYKPFFQAVMSGRYVHPGAGRNPAKSFGYVENTVHQILGILDYDWPAERSGETLVLADYEPLLLRDWANEIAQAAKVRMPRRAPVMALRLAARLGDELKARGSNFPLTTFRLNNLMTQMVYDLKATKDIVPELPFSRHDGVLRTVDWLNEMERRQSVDE